MTHPFVTLCLVRRDLDMDDDDRARLRCATERPTLHRIFVTMPLTPSRSASALAGIGGETIVVVGPFRPRDFAIVRRTSNAGIASLRFRRASKSPPAGAAIKDREAGVFSAVERVGPHAGVAGVRG